MKRVVIVGGGFAGAYAAQRLHRRGRKAGIQVTLLDRNNYLVFYPLLPEASAGMIEPRHVVVPIRSFLPRGDFRMAEVHDINLQKREVHYRRDGIEGSEVLPYDELILAPGSITRFPPIPGLKENAYELKTVAHAIELRDRAIRLLELADGLPSSGQRRDVLRIAVIGSNFTGVEVAGELHAFLHDTASAYPNVNADEIEVHLFEHGKRILPALDEELAEYATKHLRRRGLRIHTETSVQEVGEDSARLTNGEILPTRTVIWCAGIAPSPLLDAIEGLPRTDKGYLTTQKDLSVPGFPGLWAIGDSASVPKGEGGHYPATAQVAIRQGTLVADNLLRRLRGQPLVDFEHRDSGSLAAMGCRSAVAKVFGIKLSGFPAWFLYRTVYLMKMPTWGRRIRLVFDWTVDLFLREQPVQFGMGKRLLRTTEPTHAVVPSKELR